MLTSTNSINVLGVAFDSKLNWQYHIKNVTTKEKKAINEIKEEFLSFITSYYYYILYYNSKILHMQSNTHISKNKISSASAIPLKLYLHSYQHYISFITLHTLLQRATPTQIMIYKPALLLHKV